MTQNDGKMCDACWKGPWRVIATSFCHIIIISQSLARKSFDGHANLNTTLEDRVSRVSQVDVFGCVYLVRFACRTSNPQPPSPRPPSPQPPPHFTFSSSNKVSMPLSKKGDDKKNFDLVLYVPSVIRFWSQSYSQITNTTRSRLRFNDFISSSSASTAFGCLVCFVCSELFHLFMLT